ncbi:GntR family transcriptional regulator [Rhodobium gokarnense]|uniref:DNA-binding GntR family transcriptional regulator n=1 Tax=Rhodobium gokarnense TaxID=364296 RepID=A0ABT3H991_9HYPH|nr:GntR family transcriptional regulator [Rhodobium gokarnense]MCW2306975.1 DNA-binding GntR family transcriptional regulator [Rhodobium gokarnense]
MTNEDDHDRVTDDIAPGVPARESAPADVPPEIRPAGGARERFERLHIELRNRICLLDYPPGTRLREADLAREFGISRTPLRRVLGWLEAEGLLRSVQSVGTLVTDVDVEELQQVYQLRMELAEMVGHLSPVSPSAETVQLFRDLKARSCALVDDPRPRAFAEINMDFFHALMRLTASEPLREISERLYYQTSRIWLRSISQMDLVEEVEIFAREVADICAAVEIGDLSAAGHIRRSHISMSFTRVRRQKVARERNAG